MEATRKNYYSQNIGFATSTRHVPIEKSKFFYNAFHESLGRVFHQHFLIEQFAQLQDKGKQNIHFDFSDFFHLESLNVEHEGLDIITTEEFLLREAMTGNMKDKSTGAVSFPPHNRTNWDGQDPKELKEWLRYCLSF